MIFLRQVWTLFLKNILITLVRPWFTTSIRAFLLPVIFVAFLSYARNLFIPPAEFGIGEPTPVRSLPDALGAVSGGRDKVVFVNNGFTGGAIDRVIARVAEPVRSSGKKVEILSSPDQLADACKSTLLGTSYCIAAAVFYSSPTEGPDEKWNYTLKADGSLGGGKIRTTDIDNDAEIYIIPFQHAVDWAIASVDDTNNGGLPQQEVLEYPYTSKTAEERRQTIRIRYMGAIIDILAIAFLIGIVGVTYQLTGLVAAERELGMSQLIDCMMPNNALWQAQAARSVAAHLALDAIYAPGWIVIAIILSLGVFSNTSPGILLIFHLLAGLSLSSFSLFGASFFKRAQLSGISVTIACLLLGIISQIVGPESNGGVAILSLLFPPMNYINFTILMARWERQNLPTNMVKSAPESPWTIPGIAFWIFFIVQILVYPVLGAWIERLFYGTQCKDRKTTRSNETTTAVSLNRFTKIYRPNWFYRKIGPMLGSRRQEVLAVDDLTLEVGKGEIMVLLGANGSGKSTTLDAISGLSKISAGQVAVNYTETGGGFGLCPQRNVLWDRLTVLEHVRIFNSLKAANKVDTKERLLELITACDLDKKTTAQSRTLSGGQKRKLQLAMMFTGGSSVCCVDEVSSGLDPISRRKIWDILLAEQGERTILLTTHFLDEADLLADHIAILSKGSLKVTGSSVELKNRLGSGYRVHVYHGPGPEKSFVSTFRSEPSEKQNDHIVYSLPDSSEAAIFVTALERLGISDYSVSGPTIEDVFLKVAEEVQLRPILPKDEKFSDVKESQQTLDLLTGKRIGMAQQTWVLFCKRATILRRNWLPYLAAFFIPIIAAGLVTLFLKNFKRPGCSGPGTTLEFDIESLLSQVDLELVIGPANRVTPSSIGEFASSLPGSSSPNFNASILNNTHIVNTLEEFNNYIDNNFRNVTPGGFFLGDESSPPTFAWKGNGDISLPVIVQNAMDNLLTNVSISTQYQSFELPFAENSGQALQLIVYFGLALSVYPAFFSLYLTVERLRNVRALHYSNGVRSFPLWLAYLCFDSLIVLAVSVLVIIIFRGVSDTWYYPGYLFVVLLLYGIAATLFAYVISLLAKSQLAAFAFSAGAQAVMFLLYFIAYMSVLTYAPTTRVNSLITTMHFVIAALAPIGNVTRSIFTALNIFSTLCRGKEVASYPGEIKLYGGPILYLVLQSIFLFGFLIWWDSGPVLRRFRKETKEEDPEEDLSGDEDLNNELTRVSSSSDGLRVLHLTKSFGKFIAVQDVTFGVARGEVFALLGPNGAGKSTTISLIRGDIQPSRKGGEVFVENVSVTKQRATARAHLGVCPQFDAMDQMTVLEHLRFYARIRGISDVEHNVSEIIWAVGLHPFRHRMAAKLSGGNKRKLSLGIALMGNPTVLLLDEPSSGMDAASKRIMWRTLAAVVPGRSLVLTTHSMEEADALAKRAGIMAKRMLALGTTDYLRKRHGNAYHVHMVHKSAPHTSNEDMEKVRRWIIDHLPGASVEQKTYHGQLRFSVQALNSHSDAVSSVNSRSDDPDRIVHSFGDAGESNKPTDGLPASSNSAMNNTESVSVGRVFSLLEANRLDLGIEFYSVSQTTLDQVFLSIVGKHYVAEDGEVS
ncbi:ABC transporter domain containing protein [Coccidioides posadasii C735 delta SOWgp]|uniref:ABC transporter domain containing protein n=1 Tax=Coccidioides posadasii (strain C735) TaxID=222929 RepID=C5P4V8_COCP7|nr:ABC transporter domain containing protein [Coccidioides posadasii C735 delta SOWgp]EER27748.1 ABC transporter domain containing protein [Coccidioides posadasii C735 delta SOWgp]|eukprot:XP_003069893.1 ABC transporter domain containing protein [Coccidioides posadasii C735 delta SOWgp]